MGELVEELARPAPPTAPHELVRPEANEPPRGLPFRETLPLRAEFLQQQADLLARFVDHRP